MIPSSTVAGALALLVLITLPVFTPSATALGCETPTPFGAACVDRDGTRSDGESCDRAESYYLDQRQSDVDAGMFGQGVHARVIMWCMESSSDNVTISSSGVSALIVVKGAGGTRSAGVVWYEEEGNVRGFQYHRCTGYAHSYGFAPAPGYMHLGCPAGPPPSRAVLMLLS